MDKIRDGSEADSVPQETQEPFTLEYCSDSSSEAAITDNLQGVSKTCPAEVFAFTAAVKAVLSR